MSEIPRIAVVTGGNKGIGFAIVAELCKKFEGTVYLTARDVKLGEEAVTNLRKDGYNPAFHQLDIDDLDSIKTFAEYIKNKHGGLDVLVNNAAIAYKMNSTAPFPEQAETTIRVNFFGTLNVCKEFFPLLRAHARVINVASSAGMLDRLSDEKLKERFVYEDLTETELCQLMEEFVADANAGNHLEKGWPASAYAVSKVGVIALTRVQQRVFNEDSREDLIVNAVHPGYCNTDMTSHKGNMSAEEGAEAPVFLCFLSHGVVQPKGTMVWHDKSVVHWAPEKLPQRS